MNPEMKKYYTITFGFGFTRFLIFFFFPIFFVSIGLNGFQSGILMGLMTLTGLLFSFHMGIKSDQINQKNLLILGIILAIVHSVLLIFTRSFGYLLIVFFIGGFSMSLVRRVTDTLVFKSTKKHGKEMALYEFAKISPFLIGVILGGFIIERLGFNEIFLISAIFASIILIPALKIKKIELTNFKTHHYLKDLKNKKVLYFCIAVFIFALHYGAEQTTYTLFLTENLGLSIFQSALYMAGVVTFLLASTFVTGKLIDNKKVKKVNVLALSILLSGIGSILFVLTTNTFYSFLFRLIHEIGDGAFMISISIGILSLFGKERIGGNAGFVGLVLIMGSALGSLICGPLGQYFGYHFPHIITGITSIAAFFMILFFKRMK